MTPREAARKIGCTPRHVLTLIDNGVLKARKKPSRHNQYGYEWNVSAASVTAYASKPQAGGWPRGESRT